MAAERTIVHMSWAEDDIDLLAPIARALEKFDVELGIDNQATRHPLGLGLDLRSELEAADVILLMISPAFLGAASAQQQIGLAHERYLKGAAVVSILVRGADLTQLPFDLTPTLPLGGVSIQDATDTEAVYAEIVNALRDVILQARSAPRPEVAFSSSGNAVTAKIGHPGKPTGSEKHEFPPISDSTEYAIRGLSDAIDAARIVDRLLNQHPEYGSEAGGQLTLEATEAEQSVAVWLDQVRELYDANAVPVLHGRHVIRGLALLDTDLTTQLTEHQFLTKIESELSPFYRLLSPRGLSLWQPGNVSALADRPALIDRLFRAQFAEGLATMIEEERRDASGERRRSQSFLVHLHGPWGSGKTSLLGFLADQLRRSDSHWIVVPFNAWQHERLGAPWWSLMTAVHREGLRAPFTSRDGRGALSPGRWRDIGRSIRLLGFDIVWRIRLGWMAYLLLPVVLGVLYLLWRDGFFDSAAAEEGWLTEAGAIAKPIAAIVGLVVALLGAARGLGRSLSVGSARGAETFIRTSRDPMRTLRRRYERLVATIGRPVAVFIDDLDRCQSSYVVEVLQGVQTLLIEAPVTYVVAADRRWLYDSYAKAYRDFRSVSREPGRPLGHLFLEKTFQLSATLPQLAPDVRDEFWGWLISPEGAGPPREDPEAAERGRQRASDADVEQIVASEIVGSPAERRAEREALARRLAAPEVKAEIRARLAPFSRLLESNPRAMKRLLNAYRIELHRLLAEGRHAGRATVTPEQIALWTILSLRWPLLADAIAERPDVLGDAPSDALKPELHELWASPAVQSVVSGEGLDVCLNEGVVRALVGHAPAKGNGPGAVPSVV